MNNQDQDQRSILEEQGASNIVADAQILPQTSEMTSNIDREMFDEVGQYPPTHKVRHKTNIPTGWNWPDYLRCPTIKRRAEAPRELYKIESYRTLNLKM